MHLPETQPQCCHNPWNDADLKVMVECSLDMFSSHLDCKRNLTNQAIPNSNLGSAL